MSKEEKTAWQKCLGFLNRRALSKRQLLDKLYQAGFPGAEIREAVARAEKLGFVNDELLAGDCARYAAGSGLGRYRIRQKLRTRKFDAATIAAATESTVDDEAERARQCFELKLRSLARESDWRKKRDKVFRHLVARGFPMGTARDLAQEIRPENINPTGDEELS